MTHKKLKSFTALAVTALLVLFAALIGYAVNAEEVAETPPELHFVNVPFVGVSVRLDTYTKDKLPADDETPVMRTEDENSGIYQVNELSLDEFEIYLTYGANEKTLTGVLGSRAYTRTNENGNYYRIQIDDDTMYTAQPVGGEDFIVYERDAKGNMKVLFDSKSKDSYSQYTSLADEKKTQWTTSTYKERLVLLYGSNKVYDKFSTTSDGVLYLFDGERADFTDLTSSAQMQYVQAMTKGEFVNKMNEIIRQADTRTNKNNYTGIYVERDDYSPVKEIDENGLTLLPVKEYFGVSSEELLITKNVTYFDQSGFENPFADDEFEFQVYKVSGDIETAVEASDGLSYYITTLNDTPISGKGTAEKPLLVTENTFSLHAGEVLHIIGFLKTQTVKVTETLLQHNYGTVLNTAGGMLQDTENGLVYYQQKYENNLNFQFTNYPITAEISKNVTNAESDPNISDENTTVQFTFKIQKQLNSGVIDLTEAEYKTLQCFVVDTDKTVSEISMNKDTFLLKHNQTAILSGLKPDTTYLVTEIDANATRTVNGQETTTNIFTNYELNPSSGIQITTPQTAGSSSAVYSEKTMRNTYSPKSGLTVRKNVIDDDKLANENAVYLFRIQEGTSSTDAETQETTITYSENTNFNYKLNNLSPAKTTQSYTISTITDPETSEETTSSITKGGYFVLKAGEYAIFTGLDSNKTYRITEINPNNNNAEAYAQLSVIFGLTSDNYPNPDFSKSDKHFFTTTYKYNSEEEEDLYTKNTEITTDSYAEIQLTPNKNDGTDNLAFTNMVIEKEYYFNIEKILYRDVNVWGENSNDAEQRFLFQIERYAEEDTNMTNCLETFYVTLNCTNKLTYTYSNDSYTNIMLNAVANSYPYAFYGLPESGDSTFAPSTQKITKTDSQNGTYIYPCTIWEGKKQITVKKKGIYKISEVTSWSETDYDYCEGSNRYKGSIASGAFLKDYSGDSENKDYVAFSVRGQHCDEFKTEQINNSTIRPMASFSNVESEYAYFTSSSYAINTIKPKSLENTNP